MQTLSIQIEDDYLPNFIDYVKNSNANIKIENNEYFEQDPYFYKRKKILHSTKEDVKTGAMETLSAEQYQNEIKQFFTSLAK